MLAIVLFAVTSVWILPIQGIKSLNSTIISEKIIYYDNEYISLEIADVEDGIVYMYIEKPINTEDNILLKMRLKNGRDPPLMPIMPEANLCNLLWNEVNEPDSTAAMYTMSQAFNLNGYQCPIQKSVIKVVPWALRKQHVFDVDIDCGKYQMELTLEQCNPMDLCRPLITADLEIIMTADQCYLINSQPTIAE